jgi:beta-aspartyl-dipeptidase (metallo-type)
LEAGVPLEHITMTSDAFGSLPHFDDNGTLIKLEMGLLTSLYAEWRDIIVEEKIPVDKALMPVTANPAAILKLHKKGRILEGYEADLILTDHDYRLQHVMAKGKWMMKAAQLLRKGSYE